MSLRWDRRRLGLLIDVLAWVCRQTGKDIDLVEWPDDLKIWHDEKLAAFALEDPRIFQVARLQLSDLFANAASDYIEPDLIPKEAWEFSEKFLQTGLPPKRGRFGDHLARNILVWRIFVERRTPGRVCDVLFLMKFSLC